MSAWTAPASLTISPWMGSLANSSNYFGESAKSHDKRIYGFGEPGQPNPGGVSVGVYAYHDERAASKGFEKETFYANNLRKGDTGNIVPISFRVDPSMGQVRQVCLTTDSYGCYETEIVMVRGRYVGVVYVALPHSERRSELAGDLAVQLGEVLRSLP